MNKETLEFKTPYGGYEVFSRIFVDEKHRENYIELMSKKGYKLIGIK